MSATKPTHTPGPWKVCDGDGMHVYYVNPRIEAGEEIDDHSHDSIVAKCDDMGCMSGIPDEERVANARLIAASPALLAACKQAKITIYHNGGEEWPSYKALRETIAIAEGAE